MNIETMRKAGRIALLVLGAALILIIAVGGLLQPTTPASAAAPTSVSLIIPGGIVPGSNFTATVNITGVVNFDAASYDISFDPVVLRLNSVTSGGINGKTIPVDTWNNREPGRYSIVQNLPGLTGVSGNGSLAGLQFSVIGSLTNSIRINFSSAVLANTLAQEIPSNWIGALIQAIPPPPTPNFSISNFLVSKPNVGLNEPNTVSVLVTNSGGAVGTYPVILKVNGVKEAEENVVLEAGQIRTVSWLVARSTPGAYAIDVNGKTGQFTVAVPVVIPPPATTPPPTTSPPPATATPTQTVPVAPPPAPPQTPGVQVPPPAQIIVPATNSGQPGSTVTVANSPEGAAPPSPQPPPLAPSTFSFPSFSWPLLGGIGGAAIVIGLIIFFIVRRRMY